MRKAAGAFKDARKRAPSSPLRPQARGRAGGMTQVCDGGQRCEREGARLPGRASGRVPGGWARAR
eukprot:11089254-Lingulodinium_polyedra.AAC.1